MVCSAPRTAQVAGKSQKKRSKVRKPRGCGGPQEVFCVCQQPMDEESDDVWVACERCNGWCHTRCVGIDNGRVDKVKFTCSDCKVRNTPRSMLLVGCRVAVPLFSSDGSPHFNARCLAFRFCVCVLCAWNVSARPEVAPGSRET